MKKIEIGIDCQPGSPRPGDLLPTVLQNTPLQPKEPISMFFGAWIWEYSIDEKEWEKLQPLLRQRLVQLYEDGRIRGAKISAP